MASADSDSLPTEGEKALIAQLQEEFEEEFTRREAEGRKHPCFFGELALARVLRGNDGKLEDAIRWFKHFLEKSSIWCLDELVADMLAKFEESGSTHASLEMLPFHKEIHNFFRIVITAPQLSPNGDVIQYIPAIDFDKRGIFEELNWDHWVKFNRSMMVLRCIECQKLSEAQGRMVKCLTIIDLHDCTWDGIFYKPFDRDHEEDVSRFLREICAEIMTPVYVVNASWQIGTLANLASRFAPAKLMRRIKFRSGDVLNDKEFVALAGGQEQLATLFASREGLIANRTYGGQSPEANESDALPTDQEKEIIGLLREDFQNEFDRRAAEHRDYPFFFDDIALTRLVRGSGGSHNAARKWLNKFFEKMLEWKVDDMIPELITKFEENGHRICLEMLPFYAELKKYVHWTPCAAQSTPKGDIIQYLALVDLDRAGILEHVNWDHWVLFMRSLTLLRCMHLSQQSHAQGRLVKCLCIWDLHGCSLSSIRMPEFGEKHRKDCDAFMQHLCIETMGQQYVLNAPWLLVRLFHLFSNFLPAKFTKKMAIMSSDGLPSPEFVELVGGEIHLKELLTSRRGLIGRAPEQPDGQQNIVAGQSFEKFYDVVAGQSVVWSFELLAGSGDYFLGASDIDFSITLFALPDTASDLVGQQAEQSARNTGQTDIPIYSTERITTKAGRQNGSHHVGKSGFVMFRWSNEHSSMRGKSVHYSIDVFDKETEAMQIVESSGGPNEDVAPSMTQSDFPSERLAAS